MSVGSRSRVYGLDSGVQNTKLLRVRVVRGIDLAKKDIFGASDPYVIVHLYHNSRDTHKAQTKTIKKTLYPIWNEEFVFRVEPSNGKIVFEVFDENRITRDDFLGLVEVDLHTASIPLERQGRAVREKNCLLRPRSLKSRVRGELRLALSYISATTEDQSDDDEDVQADQDSGDWDLVALDGPTAIVPDSPAVSLVEPLPAGWEERQDANGRTFYVNHQLRNTQWARPTTSTPEPSNDLWGRHRLSIERRWADAVAADGRHSPHRADSAAGNGGPSSSTNVATTSPLAVNDDLSQLNANLSAEFRRSNFESSSSNTSMDQPEVASLIEDDGEGILPDKWQVQIAPNGRKFFIDHETKTTTWVDPRTGKPTSLPDKKVYKSKHQCDELGPLPPGWEERVHVDGRVFFIDHNTKTTQWEDPRFNNPQIAGQAVPYSRDYKRKYEYFSSHLPKPTNVPSKFEMRIRRSHVLEDSFKIIMGMAPNHVELLKTKLWIEFDAETGLDYGGLAREWFFRLSHELFNPYYGLFEYSATDNYTLQINPNSALCHDDHLSYYKFVGRVMGIAMYHGKLIDAFFIRPFYKMMLGRGITLSDMESVDSEYYNSLLWIKDNDPTELGLHFAVDEEVFGVTHSRELKPGGANIPVTNDNKDEYIVLIIKWRFVSRVSDQMTALMTGVNEFIPQNLLAIFDPNELELLMCGLQTIDVKDWKDHTVYKGGYSINHPVIQNFWKALLSMDNEMRSRLLQFVTGTSRVPMNGFRELYGSNGPQKFTIEKWSSADMLPRAHTCFNRLDLPPYQDYKDLKLKLVKAIENAEVFEGVD